MAKQAAARLRKVREIENVFIPLKDGTKLAARIWLPVDAEKNPVPAILEYLPYRKRDGTAPRDALTHPYFAAHGYAGVRVDIRGTGESDGVLMDEYLKLEQDDCLEVLAWIAWQPWCTGKCGMIGISWGGFNGLQVAARRPPSLKAVISLCSTDDRYADDVHYMGGSLLVDNFSWASMMFSLQTYPPDPLLVGEQWRKMWLERLEKLPLLIDNWLKHQRRDAYWKHGSVCENYADITAAVYAVGGWADGSPTPCRGCWPASNARRRGSSALGPIAIRTLPTRGHVSGSSPNACAGGISGSRAATPGSWTSPPIGCGCRIGLRRKADTPSGRDAGSPSRHGRART